MEWWLTQARGVPIGPVAAELLLAGIRSGKVPDDVLIREVRGTRWKSLSDVAEFRAALAEHQCKGRFDRENERTVLDARFFPPSEPPSSDRMDTIPVRHDEVGTDGAVDHSASLLEPLRRDRLLRFDEADKKTAADTFPPLPPDPTK